MVRIIQNEKRAWLIVLSCFVGVSVSVSPAFLAVFGLFIKPMSEELGLSRAELSIAPSIMALVAAMLSPFVGGVVDRWGARRVVLIGVVLLPLGLLGYSMLGANLSLFVGLSLCMGLAAAIACPLPYISALPRWFDRNLGLAISLSMMGVGVGQILLPKISAYLIDGAGWRGAWALMAGIVALVGLLNGALLFRDKPDSGVPRNKPSSTDSAVTMPWIPLKEAVRTPIFWLLAGSVYLVAQVGVGTMIHIVPMLTDRGISAGHAANAIAILGAGSLIGRLTTGFALDRLSISLVGGAAFLAQALGVLILWSGMGGFAPYIAVFFIGLAVGAETDIIPFVVRRKFGLAEFGKIFGLVYGIFSLGPVVGPLLMGVVFDMYQSYSTILFAFILSSLLAALFIILAGSMSAVAIKANR